MAGDELCFDPLVSLAKRIRDGAISPVEVVDTFLERIERENPHVAGYLTITTERARNAARLAADAIAAKRAIGPLHGVPFAVKDIIDTADIRTTCGSRIFTERVPEMSATVVQKLEEAGAIMLGKAHTTEFASDAHHRDYPAPHNPWSLDHHPGGSSSGSAISVADGLCTFAIGTDTVASIRLPAAWNGVVGMKPSWGRVSRNGVFPLAQTLDHVGPITRTPADAAAVLSAIAGRDPLDPTTLIDPVPNTVGKAASLDGLRVGYDSEHSVLEVASEVVSGVEHFLHDIESRGASIVDVRMPDPEPALNAQLGIMAIEWRCAHSETFPSRSEEYSDSLRMMLEFFQTFDASRYVEAQLGRTAYMRRVEELFSPIDILVQPVYSTLAPPLTPGDPHASRGGRLEGRHPLWNYRFTCPWDLAGVPALSLPWGFAESGLPRAVQLVGAWNQDWRLLAIAESAFIESPEQTRRPG